MEWGTRGYGIAPHTKLPLFTLQVRSQNKVHTYNLTPIELKRDLINIYYGIDILHSLQKDNLKMHTYAPIILCSSPSQILCCMFIVSIIIVIVTYQLGHHGRM